MNKLPTWFKQTYLASCLVLFFSFTFGQDTASTAFDLEKEAKTIDSLDKEFAKHFLNGDSAAIYSMYCRDAKFENLKSDEILLSWGRQIRNSIAMDTRNLLFTTTCISTDTEYLVELGIYEFKDSKGITRHKGKYLVVWKQEGGVWKMYRGMGL